MRRRAPRPISHAVQALGASLEPQTPLAHVQAVWEAAVGRDIAAHAAPTAERGGTIIVRCSAAVWAAELEMRARELTVQVNAALPTGERISRMRFEAR